MSAMLSRLGIACPDCSRQPPTCRRTSAVKAVTNASNNILTRWRFFNWAISCPPRRREGLAVLCAFPGKDNPAGSRRQRDVELTSEDSEALEANAAVSWWQRAAQQAEQRDQQEQQLDDQPLRPLNLSRSTPAAAPTRSPSIPKSNSVMGAIPSNTATAPTWAPLSSSRFQTAKSFPTDADTATSALAQTLLLPTTDAPPTSPPTPYLRAFNIVAGILSVFAVGAYAYNLLNRRMGDQGDAHRPIGHGLQPGPSTLPRMNGIPNPATLKPNPAGAGTGLFRPAMSSPKPPAAVPTPVAPNPTLGLAASAAVFPNSVASALGPEPPPTSPARERGWWRQLVTVYYISFGAQYGLVPRVRLTSDAGTLSRSGSSSVVVGFEDAGDAEYVANVMWEDLVQNGAAPSAARPSTMGVRSSAPLFLEDLAAMRGLIVEVVPSDSLQKHVHLSLEQLKVALGALVRGASPEAAAAQADKRLLEMAQQNAGAAAVDAAATAATTTAPASEMGNPSAAAAATGGVSRDPAKRLTERRGMPHLQLPTKFDFPGFDRGIEKGREGLPAESWARKVGAEAADAMVRRSSSDSSSVAAASETNVALAATEAKEVEIKSPGGPSSPSPPALTAAVVATEAVLPQVEPSDIQEPVFGGNRGLEYRSWVPAASQDSSVVMDVEAAPPPGEVAPAKAEPTSTTAHSKAAVAPSSAEVDEAMQEYLELESLFAMSMGGKNVNAAVVGGIRTDDLSTKVIPFQRRDDGGSQGTERMSHGSVDGGAFGALETLGSVQSDYVQQRPSPTSAMKSAQEALDRTGPTDAALQAALVALEGTLEEEPPDDDEMFDEYYAIFNKTDTNKTDTNKTDICPVEPEPQPPGSSSTNSSNSNSRELTAEVVAVSEKLAAVVQAVASAHASGVPPPSDAPILMRNLQRQLQDLQSRLTTSAATAAAVRQPGGLFSAPASFKPTSTSGNASSSAASGVRTRVGGSGSASDLATTATAAVDPALLVGKLPTVGAATASAASASGKSDRDRVQRAWGAWKTNSRIQEAESTLLKAATRSATAPTPTAATRASTASSTAAGSRANAAGEDISASSSSREGRSRQGGTGDDGVKVISKRVGTNRPPRVSGENDAGGGSGGLQRGASTGQRVRSIGGAPQGQTHGSKSQLYRRRSAP